MKTNVFAGGGGGTCPTDIVSFTNHYLVGKTPGVEGTEFIGWNYSSNTGGFDSGLIVIGDNTAAQLYANTIAVTNGIDLVNAIYDNYQTFVDEYSGFTDTTITVVSTSETGFYIYVNGGVNANNLQFTFTNQDGVRLDGPGIGGDGLDPDDDGIYGIEPYLFTIGFVAEGVCEVIENTPETFDPLYDRVEFARPLIERNITGEYIGWSEPKVTGWGDSVFIPGEREVNIYFDTDGIVSGIHVDQTQYNTLFEIMNIVNYHLQLNGSSFRVVGSGNNRIFIADTNYYAIGATDPYLADHTFITIRLDIFNISEALTMIGDVDAQAFIVEDVDYLVQENGLHYGTMVYPTVSGYKNVPTPMIRYLKNDIMDDSIGFQAYFTEADRWILDYQPEIYLYFAKGGGGWKNHSSKRIRRRIAHMAETDSSGIVISSKLDINPRLRGLSSRDNQHDTERGINGGPKDMKTFIRVKPFQFLGRPTVGSNGTGSFPMDRADWNTSRTGTEYPPTLSRTSIGDQNNQPDREKTMVICFKLVIRDPLNPGGYPIESDISPFFIIRPRGDSSGAIAYTNRQTKMNG